MVDVQPLLADEPRQVGRYQLTGRLTVGSRGLVYLGHSVGGDLVVVRLLNPSWVAAAGGRSRLGASLLAARQIRSPFTARVLEAELGADPPFVVSEFVPGAALQELVHLRGPITGVALEELAWSTMSGLAAVHGTGLTHRELNPAGILVGREGPRLIDVGLRLGMPPSASGDRTPGALPYVAPEQWSGSAAGSASGLAADLFSWASTITFAATGWAPFLMTGPGGGWVGRGAGGEVDARRAAGEGAQPGPDLTGMSPALAEVVRACLSPDPADRPTAAEALSRLGADHSWPEHLAGPAALPAAPFAGLDRSGRQGRTGSAGSGLDMDTAVLEATSAGGTGVWTSTPDGDWLPVGTDDRTTPGSRAAADGGWHGAPDDRTGEARGWMASGAGERSAGSPEPGVPAARRPGRPLISGPAPRYLGITGARMAVLGVLALVGTAGGAALGARGIGAMMGDDAAAPAAAVRLAPSPGAAAARGSGSASGTGSGKAAAGSGLAMNAQPGAGGTGTGGAGAGAFVGNGMVGTDMVAGGGGGTLGTGDGSGAGDATCSAQYRIVQQWPGGFKAEVTVSSAGRSLHGWRVSWAFGPGQALTQWWNTGVTSDGGNVVAQNTSYNGTVAPGGSTTFGFLGSYRGPNPAPSVSCSAQ